MLSDFDFELPEALVAQEARARGDSRLLVVDRAAGRWHEAAFSDLPTLLAPGDLVVVNDTRVFAARLLGRRDPSGGAVECLLLEQEDDAHWQALVHPGQKLKPGARFVVMDEARAPGVEIRGEICDRLLFGRRRVRMSVTGASLDAAIDQLGHVPLPPYIARPDTAADHERYQTIYARARGSIAAPTAGLHFDAKTLAALDAAGVGRTAVTLHVGYGTFKPIRVDDVAAHQVDPERYEISHDAVRAIEATRAAGRRVVAVGTTTTRALEHAARRTGQVHAGSGEADLFIRPGHTFRVVDALLTNFHLPRSSLLVLVCALAGREFVLAAYRDAVARGFRFYSYGDAMLVV